MKITILSSLVEGLRSYARHEGAQRIAFRCTSYTTNSALYPVIETTKQMLDWQPDDPIAIKLEKLKAQFRRSSLPLETAIPLLAALLNLPVSEDDYPALRLTPQQQRQRTQDALVAWLLELAENHPVLAVWEDLHWADSSTLELLGLLVEQAPTASILHVLAFRPEFTPPWPFRSHMTPIALNRLEKLQLQSMISRLAHGKSLPPDVVDHIVTKTDGVPLYVEELMKMLLESDLLHEETDCYVSVGPLRSLAIPNTLQDSLMARLDQINAAKEIAQVGAVLGREFDYDLLAALAPQPEECLQSGLSQLVEAELLYQRGRPPRSRYIFKHALIQDAAYLSLLKTTRQNYHKQIAQLMENRLPDLVASEPELVAHHYTEANYPTQAVQYWQAAGQRAAQHSAHQEAIAHLNQGLAVLRDLPDTPERMQQELMLQVALGGSLFAVKGYAASEVEQVYTRARELCQHIGETPQLFSVLWGLWAFYQVKADLKTTREIAEQLLSLASHQQDSERLMGAHLALGEVLCLLGEFSDARAHLDQCMALYDPERHPFYTSLYGLDPGIFCLAWLPLVLWHMGYLDQARDRCQELLSLAQDVSHPFSLAIALDYASMFYQISQDGDETGKLAKDAIDCGSEHGFNLYLAWGHIMHGAALSTQEDPLEGIQQLRQGIADWQSTGAACRLPYYLTLLAEAYRYEGRFEECLQLLEQGLSAVEQTGERHWVAEIHRLIGELIMAQEADETTSMRAEACFQQALSIARQQEAKSLELRAGTSLSRLWQHQGRHAEAQRLLAPVYEWFREGGDTADLDEAKTLLEELRTNNHVVGD